MFTGRATYPWKYFDDNYNFALDITSIRGLQKNVMGLQGRGSLNFKNFGTPDLGVSGQNDIWVQPSWLSIENDIKEKMVASLQVRTMVSLVSLCMPVVCICIKSVPTMHWSTCLFDLYKFVWMIDSVVTCLSHYHGISTCHLYHQSFMS